MSFSRTALKRFNEETDRASSSGSFSVCGTSKSARMQKVENSIELLLDEHLEGSNTNMSSFECVEPSCNSHCFVKTKPFQCNNTPKEANINQFSSCNDIQEETLKSYKEEIHKLHDEVTNLIKGKTVHELLVNNAEHSIAVLEKKIEWLEGEYIKEHACEYMKAELKKIKFQLESSIKKINQVNTKMIHCCNSTFEDLSINKPNVLHMKDANNISRINDGVTGNAGLENSNIIQSHVDKFLSGWQQKSQKLAEENEIPLHDLRDVSSKSTTLSLEKSILNELVEKKDSELANVQWKLTLIQGCLNNVKAHLTSNSREQIENVKTLQSKCDNLKQQLEQERLTSTDFSGKVEELEKELETCQSRLQTLSKEKKSLCMELQANETCLESLRIENWTVKAKLDEMMIEYKVLTEKLDESKRNAAQYPKPLLSIYEWCIKIFAYHFYLKKTKVSDVIKLKPKKPFLNGHKINNEELKKKAESWVQCILDCQKKVSQRDNDIKAVEEELSTSKNRLDLLQLQLEKQKQESDITEYRLIESNKHLELDLSQALSELKQLQAKQDEEDIESNEKWKQMYVTLQEQIKPFQGQLEAYAAEKLLLLNETNIAHAAIGTVGKKYAELLGHQNQKQKIKHILNIKQEALNLRQENHKLRMQLNSAEASYQK